MGNKEKGKGKGGVFKAAVVGAASGVIPKGRCRHKDEHTKETRRTQGQERNGHKTKSTEDVKPRDYRFGDKGEVLVCFFVRFVHRLIDSFD